MLKTKDGNQMITTFPVYLIDREFISFVPDLPEREYQMASIEDLDCDGIKDLDPSEHWKTDLWTGDRLQLLEGIFTVNYKIANGKSEMYLSPASDCTG